MGNSTEEVPSWHAANPTVKCDVRFIDGAKGMAPRTADVEMFKKLAAPHAMLFGDEANTVACMSGEVDETHELCKMTWDTEWAWNRLVRSGFLKWHACSKPSPSQEEKGDIICLWSYAKGRGRQPDARAELR